MKKRTFLIFLCTALMLLLFSASVSADPGGKINFRPGYGVAYYDITGPGENLHFRADDGDINWTFPSGKYTIKVTMKSGAYLGKIVVDGKSYEDEELEGDFTFTHGTADQEVIIIGGIKERLKTIDISGIDKPVQNKTAGSTGMPYVTDYFARYTLTEAHWYRVSTGKILKDTDKFIAGERYRMIITLKPMNGRYIDNTTVWNLNGGKVDYYYSVTNEDGTISVWTGAMTVLGYVNQIVFNGTAQPQAQKTAGETLASVSVPADVRYRMTDIYWTCTDTDKVLAKDEIMLPERSYALTIRFATDGGFIPTSDTKYILDGNFPSISYKYWKDGEGYIRTAPVRLEDRVTVSWYAGSTITPIGTKDITRGAIFPAPKAPDRVGENFEGWYTEVQCINLYDDTKPVTDNLKLYAKYSDEEFVHSITVRGFGAPVAGDTAAGHNYLIYSDDEGNPTTLYGTEGYYWYDVTEGKQLSSSECFVSNHEYQQYCIIKVSEGYYFDDYTRCNLYRADGYTPVSPDTTKTGWMGPGENQKYFLIYTEPQLAIEGTQQIDKIEIFLFGKPVQFETAGEHNTIALKEGSPYYFEPNDAGWFSEKKGSWMDEDEEFEAGDEYYQGCILKPMDGWEFAANPEIILDGGDVEVYKAQLLSDEISYEVFAEPQLSGDITLIQSVGITGYSVPAAGQSVADNTKNLAVPPHSDVIPLYGLWYDLTGSCLAEDTFLQGHEYMYYCIVMAKDGCYFDGSTACTINGSTDLVDTDYSMWCGAKEEYEKNLYRVAAKKVTAGKESMNLVNTAAVNIEKPAAGVTAGAANKPSVPAGACYAVTESYWYNETAGLKMTDGEVFNTSDSYRFYCTVKFNSNCGLKDNGTVSFSPAGALQVDSKKSSLDTAQCLMWSKSFKIAAPVCPTAKYTDVPPKGNWAHEGIDFCVERGLMGSTQTDALTFEPLTPCTRGMIVSIFYRLEGSPAVTYKNVFPDVPKGKWFSDAVIWAYQNGVVYGYDTGLFGPGDQITREQMAAILKRYTELKTGSKASAAADLSAFADANLLTWSKADMQWTVAKGYITGKAADGKTYLDPKGTATRQEVATILMRYIKDTGI